MNAPTVLAARPSGTALHMRSERPHAISPDFYRAPLRLYRGALSVAIMYGFLYLFYAFGPTPRPVLAVAVFCAGFAFTMVAALTATLRRRHMTMTVDAARITFKRSLLRPREIMPLGEIARVNPRRPLLLSVFLGAAYLRIERHDGYVVMIPDIDDPEAIQRDLRVRLQAVDAAPD